MDNRSRGDKRSRAANVSEKVKGMKKDDFWREARRDIPGPLGGLRVLEATTSWAGPMCACMLADLGADVIKVEEPGGEVTRRLPPFVTGKVGYLHATVNRNKRSLTLDLRQSEGRDIFLKLAARSDVVVENFRPGTLAGWGCRLRGCAAGQAGYRLRLDKRMGTVGTGT
jgi:formyl-CoA transferase